MRGVEKEGWEALEGGMDREDKKCSKDKEIMCFTTRPVEVFEVLNNLVVDRGPSPYVSLLELFGDEHHLTTVQADGLTVATPTGSTAYSLSAGGSLVHPEIPAILITPLCPHTLSFRPMLLPDSSELRICVPYNSRSTAWASFDGRGRVELKQGDHIKVTASQYPFPTVCADKQSSDWFNAIARTLKWNERERQKSFVVVEEGPAKPKKKAAPAVSKPDVVVEEDDEDDDDEEEEKFDIDDSASATGDNGTASPEECVPKQKALDALAATRDAQHAREAAHAMTGTSPLLRVKQANGSRNGIVTPDRFGGPHPQPPRLSPRHVQFQDSNNGSRVDLEENIRLPPAAQPQAQPQAQAEPDPQDGDRDHIHSPQLLQGGRSRIPKDRDVDAESMNVKTPTIAEHRRGHHRAPSRDAAGRRAFAVWGHDESDSNASDSDC